MSFCIVISWNGKEWVAVLASVASTPMSLGRQRKAARSIPKANWMSRTISQHTCPGLCERARDPEGVSDRLLDGWVERTGHAVVRVRFLEGANWTRVNLV